MGYAVASPNSWATVTSTNPPRAAGRRMPGIPPPILSPPLTLASEVESTMLIVLIQLCVIVAAARIFAWLFRRLGQPIVVGEILAGLILGPSMLSILGEFLPAETMQPIRDAWSRIFDPSVSQIFTVISQLGLVFLLFLIGLEFDFSHLKRSGKASLLISIVGIVLPFGLGYLLAIWMHPEVGFHEDPETGVVTPIKFLGFALFMGTAMSITAIPILGRIMMELDITRSRLGAITITSAAIDDAFGWILLATCAALVKSTIGGEFHWQNSVLMLGESIGFAAIMIFMVRPFLRKWATWALRRDKGELGINSLAMLFILMFLCAISTNLIGIFSIFGAFILGATLSTETEFREAIRRQLSQFVTAFFLPIFFTYTGLRTDVGALEGGMLWVFAGAVSAAAIIGKFGGCTVAARVGGLDWRESSCVGVMMNTRALMELIVINVGYELGVIPKSVFCMLVMMAVLTTIMTTPILLRLSHGTELEPMIAGSSFGKGIAKVAPT